MILPALLFFDKFMLILISGIGAWLAVLVYTQSRGEKLNQYFALMILFLLIRLDFAFFGYAAPEISQTIAWFKASAAAGALFLLAAYYFYVLYFLKEKGKNIFLEWIILAFSAFSVFISGFTNFIIKNVETTDWGVEIKFGELGMFLNAYVVFMSFVILCYFFRRYFSLSKTEKSQVFYFLLGALIFASANIVFTVIYPAFLGTVRYSPLGNYSTVFFFIFTAYAIVKRELFGVRVIFTTLVVALITILFLIDTLLLTPDFLFKVFKGIIIIIFIYFGYLLINATRSEIERRQEVEVLADELRKLNETLEDKVKERTKELEKSKNIAEERAGEIEKWYKFTVGRELRMAELKVEIKKKEEEIKRIKASKP